MELTEFMQQGSHDKHPISLWLLHERGKTRSEVKPLISLCVMMLFVVAGFGITSLYTFPKNEQICLQLPREMEAWPPAARPPLLQAVSCIGSGVQVLWKRHRGGWKTLISTDFFFLFLSRFHRWSPLFLNTGGKTLPFNLKRGTNKAFFFLSFFLVRQRFGHEWGVLRLFLSPLPSLPPHQ